MNVTEWGANERNMQGHRWPLNLQLFADGEAGEGEAAEGGEPVLYTKDEVAKLIQSEADRRVAEAVKTTRTKLEKEYAKKLESEKDEAARMAKLSEEERAREEFAKEKEALEAEKSALQRERLEMEIAKQLTGEGLKAEFASFLMGKDADESKKNIDSFKKLWNESLEEAINDKLGGKPPVAGGSKNYVDDNPFSKEHFNLTKQAELLKENPQLYKELKSNANI